MLELPKEILDALSFMRGQLSGLIRFDTEYLPIRVVFAPDGRVVAPVMESMLRSSDCAIYLPEEPREADDEIAQLMVTLDRFEESGPDGALADRWRIYHGEPEDVRWAAMTIDFCKFGGFAFDGEAVTQANPLEAIEPILCREVNPSREQELKQAVLARVQVDMEAPRLVGVDPLGFDIRGRFEVSRIPVATPMADEAAARARLDEILAGSD
ncbi:MAG: DUF2470 domain-containing protein [Phycisphaera sp.]|nr:DUF2470 domain-containing protein [Phycisphaera sp.]